MLGDLRKAAEASEIEEFDDSDDEFPVDIDFGEDEDDRPVGDGRWLGMTAGERALLSLFLFMNVTVLGLALLVVTGRLQF